MTLTHSRAHSIVWLCSGGSRFPTTPCSVDIVSNVDMEKDSGDEEEEDEEEEDEEEKDKEEEDVDEEQDEDE